MGGADRREPWLPDNHLPADHPRRPRAGITLSWVANAVAAGARGLTGATARWINCAPEARQRVYFANHTSHLDFVVLWSVLPRPVRDRTRPVAARDYWSSGLRKRIAVN